MNGQTKGFPPTVATRYNRCKDDYKLPFTSGVSALV